MVAFRRPSRMLVISLEPTVLSSLAALIDATLGWSVQFPPVVTVYVNYVVGVADQLWARADVGRRSPAMGGRATSARRRCCDLPSTSN